jgi:transposase
VIGSTRQVTVHVYAAPADMRKSFDSLSALVVQGLGRDVLSGDLFLFVSRTRTRAKVLYWDGTGLCVFAKRLERGRFTAPWERGQGRAARLTMSELALFLEGSEFVGRMPLSPAPFVVGSRSSMGHGAGGGDPDHGMKAG